MNISDQAARDSALDMTASVIVQAPAGSGKTELLCQRVLAALAQVDQPEQVLAITFTRKAANEMRERILRYLRDAEKPLVQKVLAQDQKHQWQLLVHPERLSVMTIDGLCARIVDQSPVSSGILGYQISESPEALYRAAVLTLLEDADEAHSWQEALHSLLLSLGNRWQKLEELLINMLAKREQWLMLLPEVEDANQWRSRLEKNLAECVEEAIAHVKSCMPESLKTTLMSLMDFASSRPGMAGIHNRGWETGGHASLSLSYNDEEFYQSLSNFVLTQSGELRKSVDKRSGFPVGEGDDKEYFKAQKQKMLEVLAQLAEIPGMVEALQALSRVPTKQYSDEQWQRVIIVLQVLRALLAYWQLTIQQKKSIDFTEIALKALMVLGREDEPSELALALDYRLQHILVDEFQDTSLLQYRLLERLTQSWQEGDGRTLFLVGDPLQSIYRFRQAEVGLFLRVWEKGFGNLQLRALQLTQNFRSEAQLINFYNEKLSQVLPKISLMQEGAVKYVDVVGRTVRSCSSDWLCAVQPTSELISQLIEIRTEYPEAKIAILVRSRTHLKDILPALRAAKIDYQARDLSMLVEQPVMIDLMSWLKALLNLEDRLAWLSMLHAPWLQLNLRSLQILFEKDDRIVWQRLQDDALPLLEAAQAEYLSSVMRLWQTALMQLQRQPLDQVLRMLWRQSGAEDYWNNELSQQASQQFWRLLQQYQIAGDLPDLSEFETHLSHLAFSPKESTQLLEVMTIHKAKGLEFDFVLLPGLERAGQHDDLPLLVFDEVILSSGVKFVLAPLRKTGQAKDAIFDFIWQLQKIKAYHERLRILYVACTRAKRGLYFYAEVEEEGKPTKSGSFLADLAPIFLATA